MLKPLTDSCFAVSLALIEEAEDFAGLQTALEAMLRPYGLQHVVYHALRIPAASISQSALVRTYPTDWISEYASRRYYNIDPVVIEAQRGIVPFDWRRGEQESKIVRRFFQKAEDAGIGRHGLTVPLRGALGERALFTVTSQCSDRDWRDLRLLYVRDMQVIASYTHSRILSILGIPAPSYGSRLSKREVECLQWAAAGKTVEDTGEILTLSASAVRLYLDSARHKLDSLTKTQAVARALALGLVSV